MYKPKNVDDCVDLINQALFVIDAPILCAGDEGDIEYRFVPARAGV